MIKVCISNMLEYGLFSVLDSQQIVKQVEISIDFYATMNPEIELLR